MFRSLAKILLGIGVLTLPLGRAAECSALDPTTDGLLLVQLEAAPSPFPAKLEIDDVSLVGRSAAVVLEPSRRELDSEALSHSSERWIEHALAPGVYDTLRIVLRDALVRVGPAWIHPARGRDVLALALNRRVVAGQALVLTLRWRADLGDPESEDWAPRLELSVPSVPSLGERLYVSDEESGIVAVIDRSEGRLVDALVLGGQPQGLAWDPVRRRLYVAVAQRDEIAVVDLAGQDLIRRIPLRFGDDPRRLALTQRGEGLAVLATGRDEVVLLSVASLQERARVAVSRRPVALVEDPSSGLLYVSCELGGRLDVIDVATAERVSSFDPSQAPGELALLGRGESLVVAGRGGRRLELIDPASGAALERLDLCGPVTGLASQPRQARFYASLGSCQEVAVLRTTQMVESERIELPGAPGLLTLDAAGRALLVVLPERGEIADIPTHRPSQLRILSVGRRPYAVVAP